MLILAKLSAVSPGPNPHGDPKYALDHGIKNIAYGLPSAAVPFPNATLKVTWRFRSTLCSR